MYKINKFYVYEWIRLDTNEPFYVGKGQDDRCYKLKRGNNNHFNNIVRKIPTAVCILHNKLTEKDAFEYECWYINEYKYNIGYNLVNITDGGEGASVIGRYKNDKNPRARMVVCLNTNTIFNCIKEAREHFQIVGKSNISGCCKGKFNYCGKLENGERLVWRYYDDYINLDKIEISDLIKKAQKSKRGKNHSNYGGKLSKRGGKHTNSKKVLCKTTNEVFNCIADAMRKYNIIGSSDIGKVCNGKRKYAGKDPINGKELIWEWVF